MPTPSGTLNAPPPVVALTFDEAVEPRFAIISVTNAAGRQETTAPVSRSPANPDTLVVPLRPHLPEGWYLVYWRAISVDGHPVQGAYTFAIGPNAGPQPQFPVPSIAETATTPKLLVARWLAVPDRDDRDRPVRAADRDRPAAPAAGRGDEPPGRLDRHGRVLGPRPARDSRLPRHRDLDRLAAVGPRGRDARPAVPRDGLRARLRRHGDLLRPLLRRVLDRRLGRPPAARAPLDRRAGWPPRAPSLAAAAVLILPGTSGHAGQTSPRGLSLLLDWLHLVSGSIWLGGLVGLLLVWATLPPANRVAGLTVTVPRFSNVAFVSVLVLIASGTGATDHPPADPRRALADVVRQDDPRQDRPAPGGACSSPPSTSCARSRTSRRRESGRSSGPPAAKLLRPARHRRGRDRRLRRLRGGAPLEPRAARQGARGSGIGARARRPRQGRPGGAQERLYDQGPRLPEPGRGPEQLRAPAHQGDDARFAAPT